LSRLQQLILAAQACQQRLVGYQGGKIHV
jgi:hypothetical protein